jgi:hypothetical protein
MIQISCFIFIINNVSLINIEIDIANEMNGNTLGTGLKLIYSEGR